MLLILKCVTSPPSFALRLMTIAPDCASSKVVMLATCGVSPTGVTVIVEVTELLWAATDVPFSEDSTSKLPVVSTSVAGVNFRPDWASAKVM